MLHRIEWVEHSSKRDGETHLSFPFSARNSAFFNEMTSLLLSIRSRCWWWHKEEQQMLVGVGGKRRLCFCSICPCSLVTFPLTWSYFWSTSRCNTCCLFSRGQLKNVVSGIWNSNSARRRVWPENTSRSTAQNTTGTWLSAWAYWKPQTTEICVRFHRCSHPHRDADIPILLPLTRDKKCFINRLECRRGWTINLCGLVQE